MAEKNERPIKVVAENRKARFNYAIEDTLEVGIALTGTEVKSIRNGKTTIAESYADSKGGEIWLINANIPEYLQANRFNHEPKRPRKLLLHKKQINKLMGAVERDGMTHEDAEEFFSFNVEGAHVGAERRVVVEEALQRVHQPERMDRRAGPLG